MSSFIKDLKTKFDDWQLVPLKVLDGNNWLYKRNSASFHTFFSSDTGKELAKKILGLQAGDQIPGYLLPAPAPRPLSPGQAPRTKSLVMHC